MSYFVLFADADWIKLATFLVIGTFYVISYLAGKLRDRQVANKNQAPKRPAKAEGDAIAGELEEFLKKAQKREPLKKQTPRQELQPVAAASRNDTRKTRRRGQDRGEEKKRRTLAAPIPTLTESRAKDDAQRKRGEGVEEHVRHAIDTRKFDQRAAQLGQLDTTTQMQSHLQEAFSHQLGTLGAATAPAAMTPSTPAATAAAARSAAPIAAMLSGGNLKQAVILKEILERPEDRWS